MPFLIGLQEVAFPEAWTPRKRVAAGFCARFASAIVIGPMVHPFKKFVDLLFIHLKGYAVVSRQHVCVFWRHVVSVRAIVSGKSGDCRAASHKNAEGDATD